MSQPKQCVGLVPFRSGTPMGQVMLLSLSNSGTDWFMDAYHHHTKCGMYYREFFNPTSNLEDRGELVKAFGSDMSPENVVRPWEELPTTQVYERTWRRSQFDLTKETWLPFKVGFFAPRFDLFVLVRSVEESLPPSRPKLVEAGLAMSEALEMGRRWLAPELLEMLDASKDYGDDELTRMVAAYCVMWRKLLEEAWARSIPVVRYSALMSKDLGVVEKELAEVPAVTEPRRMAEYMSVTRRVRFREPWGDKSRRLLERMAGMMGERVAAVVAPTTLGRAM